MYTGLMRPQAAAIMLDVAPNKIKRMVDRREIPFVMLPSGDIRFDPRALEEWCQGLMRKPSQLALVGAAEQ